VRSDLVRPFVEAAVAVLGEATGLAVIRGDLTVQDSPISTMGVASVIGIIGEFDGRVVVDMSRQTACRLAAQMNGLDATEYNDLVTSTINELTNMISGHAVSELINKGFRLEMTPPTLFSGKDMAISNAHLDTVVIPLELKYGKVVINLAIKA
jgi:chemotaxis protein CheX